MTLPFSGQWQTFAALALALSFISPAAASAKDFDGLWSVNIIAENDSCPTQTIPVQVSDGAISFSGFGATATGAVSTKGAIRLKISMSKQVVKVDGQAHGRQASGSWHTAPAGCAGRWSAQIAD